MKSSSATQPILRGQPALSRITTWACWGLLALILTSCASPQTRFLRTAKDHDTQRVVAEHLGPPTEVWPLADGETLWSYRTDQSIWAYWYPGFGRGSTAGHMIEGPGLTLWPGGRCTEYVLRFGREQILRSWIRQPCRGFETAPGATP